MLRKRKQTSNKRQHKKTSPPNSLLNPMVASPDQELSNRFKIHHSEFCGTSSNWEEDKHCGYFFKSEWIIWIPSCVLKNPKIMGNVHHPYTNRVLHMNIYIDISQQSNWSLFFLQASTTLLKTNDARLKKSWYIQVRKLKITGLNRGCWHTQHFLFNSKTVIKWKIWLQGGPKNHL